MLLGGVGSVINSITMGKLVGGIINRPQLIGFGFYVIYFVGWRVQILGLWFLAIDVTCGFEAHYAP